MIALLKAIFLVEETEKADYSYFVIQLIISENLMHKWGRRYILINHLRNPSEKF